MSNIRISFRLRKTVANESSERNFVSTSITGCGTAKATTIPNCGTANTRENQRRCVSMGNFLFTLVLTIIVFPVWSNPIDEITARKVAVQTLSRSSANSSIDATRQETQVTQETLQLLYKSSSNNSTDTEQANAENETVYFYVFGTDDNDGFVIVAGDDRVAPVLGYSNSNSFPADNLPDNLKWWLDEYARQIEYAIENNIEPTQEIKQQWEQILGVKESNNEKK